MMTRGLARKNNLGDLTDPQKALANLGLAVADYNRIRGLYAVGLTNTAIQRIASSTSNFQSQINSMNSVLSGIDPGLYANRTGDTLTGTWTNIGTISAQSFVSGGTLNPSNDALFVCGPRSARIAALFSIELPNGLYVRELVSEGNAIQSTEKPTASSMPLVVSGTTYRIETT